MVRVRGDLRARLPWRAAGPAQLLQCAQQVSPALVTRTTQVGPSRCRRARCTGALASQQCMSGRPPVPAHCARGAIVWPTLQKPASAAVVQSTVPDAVWRRCRSPSNEDLEGWQRRGAAAPGSPLPNGALEQKARPGGSGLPRARGQCRATGQPITVAVPGPPVPRLEATNAGSTVWSEGGFEPWQLQSVQAGCTKIAGCQHTGHSRTFDIGSLASGHDRCRAHVAPYVHGVELAPLQAGEEQRDRALAWCVTRARPKFMDGSAARMLHPSMCRLARMLTPVSQVSASTRVSGSSAVQEHTSLGRCSATASSV